MNKYLTSFLVIGALFVGYGAWILVSSPDPMPVRGCMVTSMNQVDLCPGSPSYSILPKISDDLINAVLVSEDISFFDHSGFEWYEIKESFLKNILKGRFARGGSTITQQFVKNVFLSQDKSITRKLKEAYLTVQIEDLLNKEEILEKYLNIVEFGPGIYGIKDAANKYFGKSPYDLNVLESAYLAHLLPNPKDYSKTFREGKLTEFSEKRVHNIVEKLWRFEKISGTQYISAKGLVSDFPWSFVPLTPSSGTYEAGTFENYNKIQDASEKIKEELAQEYEDPPTFDEPSQEERARPEELAQDLEDPPTFDEPSQEESTRPEELAQELERNPIPEEVPQEDNFPKEDTVQEDI